MLLIFVTSMIILGSICPGWIHEVFVGNESSSESDVEDGGGAVSSEESSFDFESTEGDHQAYRDSCSSEDLEMESSTSIISTDTESREH